MSAECSTFVEDTVTLLNVEPGEYYLSDRENWSDFAEIAIKKFEHRPSVQAIKESISVHQNFYLSTLFYF